MLIGFCIIGVGYSCIHDMHVVQCGMCGAYGTIIDYMVCVVLMAQLMIMWFVWSKWHRIFVCGANSICVMDSLKGLIAHATSCISSTNTDTNRVFMQVT